MLDVVRWRVQCAASRCSMRSHRARTPGEAFALGGIRRLQAGHVADAVVVDDDLSPQTVLRRAAWLTSR